jgi:hypothetical protein
MIKSLKEIKKNPAKNPVKQADLNSKVPKGRTW